MSRKILQEEVDDLRKLEFWKGVLAKFVRCFYLGVIALGSTLHEEGTEGHGTVHKGLTAGFLIAILIAALTTVSGGHVNPCTSMGFAVTREITVIRFVLYVLAQSAGAVAGAGLLKAITPESKIGNLGLILPAEHVTDGQAIVTEILISSFMLFVTFALIDKNRFDTQGAVPFIVGMSISVNIFYAINTSGACMNPCRAFGPAVVMGRMERQWIYWVGPMTGGAVGALLYVKLFSAPPPHTATDPVTSNKHPCIAESPALTRPMTDVSSM